MHEHLLSDRQRILGPCHPDTFTSRHNLAVHTRSQVNTGKRPAGTNKPSQTAPARSAPTTPSRAPFSKASPSTPHRPTVTTHTSGADDTHEPTASATADANRLPATTPTITTPSTPTARHTATGHRQAAARRRRANQTGHTAKHAKLEVELEGSRNVALTPPRSA